MCSIAYTHLVVLEKQRDSLQLKEFLDIALVSASYDVPTAVFFSEAVVTAVQTTPTVELEQAVNMLAEFDIPLFAETEARIYEHTVLAQPLSALKQCSQHVLIF